MYSSEPSQDSSNIGIQDLKEDDNNNRLEPPEGFMAIAQSPNINNMASSSNNSTSSTSHHPTKVLLVSLIESLCQVYGDTPEMKRQVFLKLCQRLSQAGIIHYEFMDELASLRSSYHKAFNHLFYQTTEMVKRGSPKLITSADSILSVQHSRYRNDFIEESMIGRGGFASAWKARNKLDDIVYAVKKIRLVADNYNDQYEKIFREIKSLARLEHRNVVRYYSSWLEYASALDEEELDEDDYSFDASRTDDIYSLKKDQDKDANKSDGFILYIQMQLCPSTLQESINTRNQQDISIIDQPGFKKTHVELFTQILSGAAYIHQQGLIHRDLKPGNIFLTYDNDTIVPKIGDFGLAASIMEQQVDVMDNNLPKITLIEEMSFSNSRVDSSNNMMATTLDSSCSSSTDTSNSRCSSRESRRNRTIGVGTRTYAAPEQLEGTTYDEKADIYSLGIILFELLQPFSTMMERSHMLTDLKLNQGQVPPDFLSRYPAESKWIEQMMHQEPCQRPSALELLQYFDDTLDSKYLQMKQEKEELQRRLNDLEAELAHVKLGPSEEIKMDEEISHAISKMLT